LVCLGTLHPGNEPCASSRLLAARQVYDGNENKGGCCMPYAWLFVGSYVLALVGVFAGVRIMNNRAAERLRANAVTETQIGSFHRNAMPPVALLVRPALFFGTILGAVASLGYWLIG
jgi:hypothetical protein